MDNPHHDKRTMDRTIHIKGTADQVWRALAEAEHLQNWFPSQAKITPGKGGVIWFSWPADEYTGEARIEVWEPGRHLRTTWPANPEPGAAVLVSDWFIESRGGVTKVRIVESGFWDKADWEDSYDATSRGWAFELRGLRHYIERHFGTARKVAYVKQPASGSLEETWRRVIGPEGLGLVGDGPFEEFAAYRLAPSVGGAMSGDVRVFNPPKDFAGIVRELNDGYLRVRIDKPCVGGDGFEAHLWLSLYGVDDAGAQWEEGRMREVLRRAMG